MDEKERQARQLASDIYVVDEDHFDFSLEEMREWHKWDLYEWLEIFYEWNENKGEWVHENEN